MNLDQLKETLGEFDFQGNWPLGFELSGLGDRFEVAPNQLYFAKSSKFLIPLLEVLNSSHQGVLCCPKKNNFSEDQRQQIADCFFGVVYVESMEMAMVKLSKYFYEQWREGLNFELDGRKSQSVAMDPSVRIAPNVFIGENVKIGKNCRIHPFVTIMADSVLGDDCEIYPQTVLYPKSILGNRVILHSNVVIGSDGFGYEFDGKGHQKIYHLGSVELGDDCEIGANSSVDRGTFSATRLGAGVKIDNNVQIAHNTRIGMHSVMCGQSGTSGSATIEDYVIIGGKVGIGPGVTVGAQSQIAGAAMMTGSCPPKSKMAGHPARDLNEWLRAAATLRKLSQKKKSE